MTAFLGTKSGEEEELTCTESLTLGEGSLLFICSFYKSPHSTGLRAHVSSINSYNQHWEGSPTTNNISCRCQGGSEAGETGTRALHEESVVLRAGPGSASHSLLHDPRDLTGPWSPHL